MQIRHPHRAIVALRGYYSLTASEGAMRQREVRRIQTSAPC